MAQMVTADALELEVDPATLVRSRTGSITGVIAFDLGALQFPAPGWSDFPVVVVSWWLQAASRLLRSHEDGASFRFMDGPYRVGVEDAGSQDWKLLFIDEHGSGTVQAKWVGSSSHVARVLLRTANLIDRTCTARGWESEDLSELRRSASELRHVVRGEP